MNKYQEQLNRLCIRAVPTKPLTGIEREAIEEERERVEVDRILERIARESK